MDEFTAVYALKALLLPPGLCAVLALLGLLVIRRRPRLGRAVLAAALLSFWLPATPVIAALLGRAVEHIPPLDPAAARAAGAIVVLATGRYSNAPEFGGADDVTAAGLERLRYAARLHRVTGLPLAAVGGGRAPPGQSEADLMAWVLATDFEVETRWLETRSTNTAESARFALEALPVRTVVLVTHAMHMPRSVGEFEHVGFEVIPAPMGFETRPAAIDYGPFEWIPSLRALATSREVLHERLGQLWYRIRYR